MVHGDAGADHDMFGMDVNGCIISKSATANDGLSHLLVLLSGTCGIFVRARTPEAIVSRLNQEVRRALARPEVKARYVTDGAETLGGAQDAGQFAEIVNKLTQGK